MNAYELMAKFILETEKRFNLAKSEGNFWKAEGLRKLYNLLKSVKDQL